MSTQKMLGWCSWPKSTRSGGAPLVAEGELAGGEALHQPLTLVSDNEMDTRDLIGHLRGQAVDPVPVVKVPGDGGDRPRLLELGQILGHRCPRSG